VRAALALLLLLGACAAPDYRGVLSAEEAEPILDAVPVLRLYRPPSEAANAALANAVVVGDQTTITVRHAVGGDEWVYTLNGELVQFLTVAVGEGDGPSKYPADWRISKVFRTDISSYQPLEVERDVPTGTEIFLVGYWTPPEERREEIGTDDRELVAVRGRVIDPPFILRNAARGLICVDLGRPAGDWKGLSGGAVVVRRNDGFKLVGILAGSLSFEEWPSIEANCVVPIPDCAGTNSLQG